MCSQVSAFVTGQGSCKATGLSVCPGSHRFSLGTHSGLHWRRVSDLLVGGKELKSPGTDGLNLNLFAEVLGGMHSFSFPLLASDWPLLDTGEKRKRWSSTYTIIFKNYFLY